MSTASLYNNHRYARGVLKKFRKQNASFLLELHHDHWKFAGGEERLAYDGPMRPLLECIRTQTIPTSIFASLLDLGPENLPIHDGCLIVEIIDYRSLPSTTPTSSGSAIDAGIGNNNNNGMTLNLGLGHPGLGLPSSASLAGDLTRSTHLSGSQPSIPMFPPPRAEPKDPLQAVALMMAKPIEHRLGENFSTRNSWKRGRESSLGIASGTGIGLRVGSGMGGSLAGMSGQGRGISTGTGGRGHDPNLNNDSSLQTNLFNPSNQPSQQHNTQPAFSIPPTALSINPSADPSSTLSGALRYRTLLKPDSSTLWEQLVHLNAKRPRGMEWDEQGILQLESRVLAATAPNLCLDPSSILPARTANLAMNLTYPVPSFISHDGSYIPASERLGSSLIVPTGVGLEISGSSQGGLGGGAVAERESEGGLARVAKADQIKKEMKQKTREQWLASQGLKKEDLDALTTTSDPPSEPTLKEQVFESTSWIQRTMKFQHMRRPEQAPQPNTIYAEDDRGPTGPREMGINMWMQGQMNEMGGMREQGSRMGNVVGGGGGEGGTGMQAHGMHGNGNGSGNGMNVDGEGMDESAHKPKKSKKKKKENQGDGAGSKQEDGMEVDGGGREASSGPGMGSTENAGLADSRADEKPKSKKKAKTKKERALENAASEAQEAMMESPPSAQPSKGKKRPAEDISMDGPGLGSTPSTSMLPDSASQLGETKVKKPTKKQRDAMAAKQQGQSMPETDMMTSPIAAEPPKKKAKKTKPKATADDPVDLDLVIPIDQDQDTLMLPEYNQPLPELIGGQQPIGQGQAETPSHQAFPHQEMQAAFMANFNMNYGNNGGMNMPPMDLPIQVQPNQNQGQGFGRSQQPMQPQYENGMGNMDLQEMAQQQQQQQMGDGFRQGMAARYPGQSRAPPGMGA